jgi:hypothetical protein
MAYVTGQGRAFVKIVTKSELHKYYSDSYYLTKFSNFRFFQWDEHRLKLFEDKILSRIFAPEEII